MCQATRFSVNAVSNQTIGCFAANVEELASRIEIERSRRLLRGCLAKRHQFTVTIIDPEKVAGIAGIYPVFDLRTYPGLAKAAPAYGFKADELEAKLSENNPIERVGMLAKAGVPVFIIHGDDDKVVPLKENSAELVTRYEANGAKDAVTLVVAKGQGHNFWEGFFRCPELIEFAIARARSGAAVP